MGRKVQNQGESQRLRKPHPAATPEERDEQLISLAYDRAEQQLMDGTASPLVIAHFLKLGTLKYKQETKKLESDNELLKAKTGAIKAAEANSQMLSDVIKAMKEYRGEDEESYEVL
jgi:hypothetical protein